jgi:hypothetical protein
MRRHVTIYSSRHDTDTASDEPTRRNVADMVYVVSATLRRHVGMSVVFGVKNPRHDADISSKADASMQAVESHC